MYKKIKSIFLAIALLLVANISVAQNNTNSPYTRFGYGEISDNNTGDQRAMGGVAIGSRSRTTINTVNPASYSSVDSLTFMFDVGVSLLNSRFTELGGKSSRLNANLDYITMQIPLWKNVGLSAGVLPFSSTGYSFYSQSDLPYDVYPDTVTMTQSFAGKGGISQAYGGVAVKLFNHISVGVNTYYMFGSIVNARDLSFSESDFYSSFQRDSIKVGSFRWRYGLQFFNTFNKKHDVTLGLIYEMKSKLKAEYNEVTGSVDTIITQVGSEAKKFDLPQVFGFGLNYTYDKQLTLGVDYTFQKWDDAEFLGQSNVTLTNRSKLALGAEFIPNPRGRKYFDVVKYRAGFNISDPYYKINNEVQPKNFGISFGLGLPVKGSNSVVNASFEYGKVGSSGTLREDYFKFTLNAVFNENWFFKRKL
jgi:hypothetical protein